MTIARQSLVIGASSHYGDGKPIVLVPPLWGSDLALLPLSAWLKGLGYRPVTAGLLLNLGDSHAYRTLSESIRDVTARVGRKAVLLTHSSGLPLALRAAERRRESVSDVVVFDAPHRGQPKSSVRTHFISSGWSALPDLVQLPRILRSICIELVDTSVR